jgi:hypothetical protein
MRTEQISQSSIASHDTIAYQVAKEYCANIMKDTDNTFGTLDGLLDVFRLEISERVRVRASSLWKAHRVKFRPDMFRMRAESYIRMELKADEALKNKLQSIRAVQARDEAEIRAKRATREPFPVVNPLLR